MGSLLLLLVSAYIIGFLMTFLIGLESIGKHITRKKLVATFIMSLFSFFTLWFMMFSDNKKYRDF